MRAQFYEVAAGNPGAKKYQFKCAAGFVNQRVQGCNQLTFFLASGRNKNNNQASDVSLGAEEE
ncbi:hypothetical protein [Pseudomonas sp. W2-17]|uniref:hypothetical protein n=1 Tax=Pseudomonas sp. W2-17 TaxID=3058039 RepID=UPI0034E09A12